MDKQKKNIFAALINMQQQFMEIKYEHYAVLFILFGAWFRI
jgi:hypothetical protein